MSFAARSLGLLLAASTLACEGPVGPVGDPGPPGPPGPAADTSVLSDVGLDAADGSTVDAGDIPLEPDGLVGRVVDTAALPVADGRVVLVAAGDVAALAATPIDVLATPAVAAASTVDEPLEDLLDADPGYPAAPTDADGVYRFAALPDEPVFVVFVPGVDDAGHLPGGQLATAAQSPSSLRGARLDLRVSTTPSPAARYVGSSGCLGCHGRHRSFGTAHALGLRVPGVAGYQQDTSRWPAIDAVLDRFGSTLYFYDCDGASPGPGRCKVSETAPGAPAVVSFAAELNVDTAVPLGAPGRYSVRLSNQRAAEEATYAVDLVYGGALYRNLLLVDVPTGTGRSVRYVLPFQYQHRGDDTRTDPEDWRWRDLSSSDWYDHAAGALRAPAPESSFDARCAGCHFTGFAAEGDPSTGLSASAVRSTAGTYDYDRDGLREQINVGCESCHGPGSEHLEAPVRGTAIVSPGLLTPGRAAAICGGCHSNSEDGGPPLDAAGHMPRPGIRRSELLERHLASSETGAGRLFPSGDARDHRMQYTDHVRSHKYRNGDRLVTCNTCHDPHGSEAQPHDLLFSPADNAGCASCHHDRSVIGDLRAHVTSATGDDHRGLEDDDLLCVLCHMPATATGGSRVEGLYDADPSTARAVQYFQGDIATHRYHPSGFDRAGEQPASVTQACGICHRVVLSNPPL